VQNVSSNKQNMQTADAAADVAQKTYGLRLCIRPRLTFVL
jgi:hypothetical protein